MFNTFNVKFNLKPENSSPKPSKDGNYSMSNTNVAKSAIESERSIYSK